MTKLGFKYIGKKGTFIQTRILSHAPKKAYNKDIIELRIKSNTHDIQGVMTRDEAIIVAKSLLDAVVFSEKLK